ncbi:MAG: hypothetical protein JNL13_12860, partial [Chitinophagaceae bacterium]|nr:hypothetical protein [Chitinophagaceae bacterium]
FSFITACNTASAPKNRGPIVFGDSSLIVTEQDSQYLSNHVPDFVPQTAAPAADTVKAAAQAQVDTPKTAKVPEQQPVVAERVKTGNGLQAPFKALDVFIAGIDAKPARNVNWDRATGASFTWNKGELNNKPINVSGATANKVTQRYQTIVTLQLPSGKSVKLPGFPVYTATWQTLKRSNNQFVTAGLADKQLRYESRFSPAALRNAVQKLARSNRMSRKEEEQLLRSVKNVRSADQAPLDIALQSVVWRVNATDAKGKDLEREVRVDINR